MQARQQLKEAIHQFVGVNLGELNRYHHEITNQKTFDAISLQDDSCIQQFAEFLDPIISMHAIFRHTDLSKYESPRISQMPNLIERQEQYLTYFKYFLESVVIRNVDKDLLEIFRQSIIDSINKNKEHLLKRQKETDWLIFRKADSFSDASEMITKLQKISIGPAFRK